MLSTGTTKPTPSYLVPSILNVAPSSASNERDLTLSTSAVVLVVITGLSIATLPVVSNRGLINLSYLSYILLYLANTVFGMRVLSILPSTLYFSILGMALRSSACSSALKVATFSFAVSVVFTVVSVCVFEDTSGTFLICFGSNTTYCPPLYPKSPVDLAIKPSVLGW